MRSSLPLRLVGFHLLAGLLSLLFVLPGLWVLINSLQPPGMPLPTRLEWPVTAFAWQNYTSLFGILPLGRFVANSLLVAGLAVPITLVVASWAGFAIAQLPAPQRYAILVGLVILRMVPLPALWLPRFLLFSEIGLINTLAALIAPALMGSSPFFVLIYYWSFRRMPVAYIEAARLEGYGPLTIWARIAMPLVQPASIAVSVLCFVQYWSDFVNPLLYLKTEERYTLAVGLRILQQLDLTHGPLLMAGVVVMVLPVLLVFLLVQRAFWFEERPNRVA